MMQPHKPDWNPSSEVARADFSATCDEMRRRCPVAHSEAQGWSIFRHEDVLRVLHDHETFSNVVSNHRAVPNGMDPPEHTAYRRVIEPYFAETSVLAFEPIFREIARSLLEPMRARPDFDCMEELALPFALRCQCRFLGWPEALAEPLRGWAQRNQQAARAGDRARLTELAEEFRSHIARLLEERRRPGIEPSQDATQSLLEARVNGERLTDDELVSIFRNWTVGELGTLAASVGILVWHLANDTALQRRLRDEPQLLPRAIDEILRVRGPLISNRRVATHDVDLGGRRIAAGEMLSVIWISANRDEQAFEAPEEVRLDRDAQRNLLYGAGIHVCPGAPLARLELKVIVQELFSASERLELETSQPCERAVYPAAGWAKLPMRLA